MAKIKLPPISVLRQLLTLDPGTGTLTWRERPVDLFMEGERSAARECKRWNGRYAGKPALITPNKGYRRGKVLGTLIGAHRVVWALNYGRWPPEQIDHINGDRSDNRPCNLREATQAENNQNLAVRRDNVTGFSGVSLDKGSRKFRAKIGKNGRHHYLGRFDTAEEAAAAYAAAKRDMHTFRPTVRERP